MALQEYDFSVDYIQGVTNVVADHLSRTGSGVVTVQLDGSSPSGGAVQKSIAMSALVVCCSAWPEQAVKQSELDQIACDIVTMLVEPIVWQFVQSASIVFI